MKTPEDHTCGTYPCAVTGETFVLNRANGQFSVYVQEATAVSPNVGKNRDNGCLLEEAIQKIDTTNPHEDPTLFKSSVQVMGVCNQCNRFIEATIEVLIPPQTPQPTFLTNLLE